MQNYFFLFIGGLGFFFFGMNLMSDGLKKISGDRIRSILAMVTRVPLVGVLLGALVTLLLQSSSAITVMVVGFVNAGLLTLTQAISVIMGANIGTTFTAWLVSSMSIFKITQYALPAVGLGFAFKQFGRTRRQKAFGDVLIGFGILFLGLDFMKDAFDPLKKSDVVKNAFVMFSKNPLLGVLVGTLFTFLLQSSSATIAIVQVLAFNGVISFAAAIPLILGENIGTTITAQLAATQTNLQARRAAMSHTLFNVIGVSYMLIFVSLGWYERFIDFVVPGAITLKNVMFHIAVAHSAFNVTNVFVFLPFVKVLERMSIRLVPEKKSDLAMGPQYLERRLLSTPTLALQQARNETKYMLGVAHKAVNAAVEGFLENDLKRLERALHYEKVTDNLQTEITQYLVDIVPNELSEAESQRLPVIIHNVNDLERIGDHASNIVELAQVKIEERIQLNDGAMVELQSMIAQVQAMFIAAEESVKDDNADQARKVLEIEKRVNALESDFKNSHFLRFTQGESNLRTNYVFLEFIDNLEKIADHLTNVAQAVLGKMQWRTFHQDENDPQLAGT